MSEYEAVMFRYLELKQAYAWHNMDIHDFVDMRDIYQLIIDERDQDLADESYEIINEEDWKY